MASSLIESAPRQIFRFKRFEVDQTGCAMKINTDGVLLGALATLADREATTRILDIGTGTGVIALMLAQRYPAAITDGIEIDQQAAARADRNFSKSPFAERLNAYHRPLKSFEPSLSYDLIVANPPYFVDSLKNPDARKQLARHADQGFFEDLLQNASHWLKPNGSMQLILPSLLASKIEKLASACDGFSLEHKIDIYSYSTDRHPIRTIINLTKSRITVPTSQKFTIYAERGIYSTDYKGILADFFLDF